MQVPPVVHIPLLKLFLRPVAIHKPPRLTVAALLQVKLIVKLVVSRVLDRVVMMTLQPPLVVVEEDLVVVETPAFKLYSIGS
jgi:hypothetical protein